MIAVQHTPAGLTLAIDARMAQFLREHAPGELTATAPVTGSPANTAARAETDAQSLEDPLTRLELEMLDTQIAESVTTARNAAHHHATAILDGIAVGSGRPVPGTSMRAVTLDADLATHVANYANAAALRLRVARAALGRPLEDIDVDEHQVPTRPEVLAEFVYQALATELSTALLPTP